MAANYWASTQAQRWVFTRQQLVQARAEDLRYATASELGALGIWMSNMVSSLCKRLNLRQRVSATASVFLKRFYVKNSYCATDPCLVIATCVYVASKVEESPVPLRMLQSEATRALLSFETGHEVRYKHSLATGDIAKMEFYLLEELEFDLVVHHPYRTLVHIAEHLGAFRSQPADTDKGQDRKRRRTGEEERISTMSWGEGASSAGEDPPDYSGTYRGELRMDELDDQTFMYAWFILNDIYRFDTCLRYPSYAIAVACVMLSMLSYDAACQKVLDSTRGMRHLRTRWCRARDKQLEETIPSAWIELQAGKDEDKGSAAAAAFALRSRDRKSTALRVADAEEGAPQPPGDALTVLAGMNVAWPVVEEVIAEILSNYELWHRVGLGASEENREESTTTPWWPEGEDPTLVVPPISADIKGSEPQALKFLARMRAARLKELAPPAATSKSRRR